MFTGLDGPSSFEIKSSGSGVLQISLGLEPRENLMKKALKNHKQKYWERMRDQDRELF